jgi:glycosyltransferase involved in cell wall biosynthesis
VVSERVDPRTVDIGRAWSLLRRLVYPRAAAIVVQTESVRAWAESLGDRVAVIGNPVASSPAHAHARAQEIVAVGRLVPQKGFDVLVRAFATLSTEDWRLTILGEGPSRRALEDLIAQLGVRDRVALVGEVHDVRARLRSAAVFVLASRFEGFPNALLEAMAEGAAIVATDCRSGPAEILRDCPRALLVPVDDAPALADALARVIVDEALRERCGAEVRTAASRCSPAAIAARWEDVLARAR